MAKEKTEKRHQLVVGGKRIRSWEGLSEDREEKSSVGIGNGDEGLEKGIGERVFNGGGFSFLLALEGDDVGFGFGRVRPSGFGSG